MDKAGFVLCLLGMAGIPESYQQPKSIAICLVLLIVGALLIGIGDIHNDVQNNKRNSNSNVLDRLYFLKR